MLYHLTSRTDFCIFSNSVCDWEFISTATSSSYYRHITCKDSHSCAPRTTTKPNKPSVTFTGVKRHTLHIQSVLDTFFLTSLSCLSPVLHPLHIPLLHDATSRLDIVTRLTYTSPCPLPLTLASIVRFDSHLQYIRPHVHS